MDKNDAQGRQKTGSAHKAGHGTPEYHARFQRFLSASVQMYTRHTTEGFHTLEDSGGEGMDGDGSVTDMITTDHASTSAKTGGGVPTIVTIPRVSCEEFVSAERPRLCQGCDPLSLDESPVLSLHRHVSTPCEGLEPIGARVTKMRSCYDEDLGAVGHDTFRAPSRSRAFFGLGKNPSCNVRTFSDMGPRETAPDSSLRALIGAAPQEKFHSSAAVQ